VNGVKDKVRDLRVLQDEIRERTQMLTGLRRDLEDSFGKRFSSLLVSGNFEGFVRELPIKADSLSMLALLTGEYDRQILDAAQRSGDPKKHFFIALAFSQSEAVSCARRISEIERMGVLALIDNEAKEEIIRKLPNRDDVVWAVRNFSVAPDLEGGFFETLGYFQLEELSQYYPVEVSEQIVGRGNGEGLRDGERASNYWLLAAGHVPVERAEEFFESKMRDYSLRIGENGNEGLRDEDDALRACVVNLSTRSERARTEWLPVFGLEGICASPDYVFDSLCSEKGMARFEMAKRAAPMREFRTIRGERAKRIFSSTDFDNPHSYAALVLLVPNLRILHWNLERAVGRSIPSDWQGHFVLDYFSKFNVPEVAEELRSVPGVRKILNNAAWNLAFYSSYPDNRKWLVDPLWGTHEGGNRYPTALYNAGGMYRVLSAVYSKTNYERNGGTLEELRESYWSLSEKAREWIDAHVKTVLSSPYDNYSQSGIEFAIATGICEKFDKLFAQMRKKERDQFRSVVLKRLAKGASMGEILENSPINHYRERLYVAQALRYEGGKYRIFGILFNPTFSVMKEDDELKNAAKSYGELDEEDKKWIDGQICKVLSSLLYNGRRSMLVFFRALEDIGSFEEELRRIAENNIEKGVRMDAALILEEHGISEPLRKCFSETNEDDLESMVFSLMFLEERYSIIAWIWQSKAYLKVKLEKNMKHLKNPKEIYGESSDEDKRWVDRMIEGYLENKISPDVNRRIHFIRS